MAEPHGLASDQGGTISHVGQETAEIDMEAVLASDDGALVDEADDTAAGDAAPPPVSGTRPVAARPIEAQHAGGPDWEPIEPAASDGGEELPDQQRLSLD